MIVFLKLKHITWYVFTLVDSAVHIRWHLGIYVYIYIYIYICIYIYIYINTYKYMLISNFAWHVYFFHAAFYCYYSASDITMIAIIVIRRPPLIEVFVNCCVFFSCNISIHCKLFVYKITTINIYIYIYIYTYIHI